MTCFLAVQGFQLERSFIFKEISVLSNTGKIFYTWTLKPPCSFENLSVFDRNIVQKESNWELGLAWTDGFISYNQVPLIFELIAREFKLWMINKESTREKIFRYKSLNVKIEILENFKDDAKNGKKTCDKLTCIYDHPNCAVTKVSQLYDFYHS